MGRQATRQPLPALGSLPHEVGREAPGCGVACWVLVSVLAGSAIHKRQTAWAAGAREEVGLRVVLSGEWRRKGL